MKMDRSMSGNARGLTEKLSTRVSNVNELLDDLWSHVCSQQFRDPVTDDGDDLPSSHQHTRAASAAELNIDQPSSPGRVVLPRINEVVDGLYRITDKLGEGGMGTVYRAIDLRLGRPVALKLLSQSQWSSPRNLRLFFSEARNMARVRHPNVVAIHAVGELERLPYIVMELVEGENLRSLIRKRKEPFPLSETIALADQICRGVSAIHRAGTVHRDLKPSNVLVGPTFRVAITDMGMAVPLDLEKNVLQGGTPGYTAPEAFGHADIPHPPRIDVYGIACLVYELITGRRVFEGKDGVELYDRQREGSVTPPSELNPEIPSSMEAALLRALSPNPSERQHTVNELRAELLASVERRDFTGTAVVVVDDDVDVCDAIAHQVRAALPGARVDSYNASRDALFAAKDEPPDLMIVDLMMPDFGGEELIKGLRASARTHDVPTLVVSGSGTAEDWRVLQGLGANGFLMKPTDTNSLAPLCRHLVRGKMRRTATMDLPVATRRAARHTPPVIS